MTTPNAPKSMKIMKSMKEQYDCYVIDVWFVVIDDGANDKDAAAGAK